ncbi:MAG TPA: GNAT family N-acetyltransferase [Pseudonocardia sp.]
MWVAPAARGLGVGDAALREVLDRAGRRPVVLSVRADNGPAVRLYRRHGFADAGPSPDDPAERLMRLIGRSGDAVRRYTRSD